MPVSEYLEISIQLGLVFYHPTYSSSHCNYCLFTVGAEDNSGGQFSLSTMWTPQLL